MKKLFGLFEKHQLLAPETGGEADAGAAGAQPQEDAPQTVAGGAAGAQPQEDAPQTVAGGAAQETQAQDENAAEEGQQRTILTDTAGEPSENTETAEPAEGLVTPEGMEYAEGELDEFNQITAALSPKDKSAILAWQAKYDAIKSGAVADALDKEVREFVKRQAEENKLKVLEMWGKDPAVRAKREADVARAVKHFATDEFKKLMDETGLGNHPAVVATFEAVGKAFGEDRVITGHAATGADDLAHRMFPQYK